MDSKILLHPKLIHFPIALLLTGLFVEIYLIWKKDADTFERFSNLLFLGGLIGAILSVLSGLLAEYTLGHNSPNHEFIHQHRNIMLITTTIWLISSPLINYKRQWLIFAYLLISGFVIYGADKGGNLVYKYGIGVQHHIEIPDRSNNPTTDHTHHEDQHLHDHPH